MWPLRCPKSSSAAATTIKMEDECITAAAATAAASVSTKAVATSGSTSTCHCCCLVTKLMRKLKRHGRRLRAAGSRRGSFQCRYDPLSYSLNFDSSGCGSLLDEDYYKFYAFSSRFVANPTTSCSVVPVAAGSSH